MRGECSLGGETMQAILMAVSHSSAKEYGCIECNGNFSDLELVITIGHTRFYKCRHCFAHTEFLSLDKGVEFSEIEVRVKQCPILIKPQLLPHPQAPKRREKTL